MNEYIVLLMKKEVYTIRGDDIKVEWKECTQIKLPFTSKYIAPYWYAAIRNVFEYDKIRGLQTIHKLTSDDRIASGYKLYKNKHIKEIIVTTYSGGDVRAIVLSEDKTEEHTVIIKNFLPQKLPQYNFEREDYIANLIIRCDCTDSSIGAYKHNSSMIDKHSAAVIWFLIDRFNMPRIFVLPEQKMVGYQKSDIEELEVEIYALPLVKFTQHINILLMKKYKSMQNPALGVSIHRVDNLTYREEGKPQWLSFCNSGDVERLLKGISRAYTAMEISQGKTPSQIQERLCMVLGIAPKTIEKLVEKVIEKKVFIHPEKKHWWNIWGFGRKKS